MKKFLARTFLKLTGWTAQGGRPEPRRYVLIAAPHTSNWDLPYLLAFAWIFEIRIAWMGKHQLFRPPLGGRAHVRGRVPGVGRLFNGWRYQCVHNDEGRVGKCTGWLTMFAAAYSY